MTDTKTISAADIRRATNEVREEIADKPKKATMWSITQDEAALISLLDELDGGEMSPEQSAAFDALFALNEKDTEEVIERRCNARAYLRAKASADRSWQDEYYAHAERHNQRAIALENAAERIEKTLKAFGIASGRLACTVKKTETTKEVPAKKINAGPWIVSIQNAGGVVPMLPAGGPSIEDVETAGEGERFIEFVKKPNNVAIREALEKGEKLAFASLGERSVLLKINSTPAGW